MRPIAGLLALAIVAGLSLGLAGEWLGFPPYPAARDLCSERVHRGPPGGPSVEIQWWSYATSDPPQQVFDFYSKTNKEVERGKDSFTVRRGKDTVLSVHPASAPGYPTCANKPQPGDKTVIVVSQTVGAK